MIREMNNHDIGALVLAGLLASGVIALTSMNTHAFAQTPGTIEILTTVRDFKGMNEDGGHPDFEDGTGTVQGIVQMNLGSDKKPVYCCPDPPFPSTTHGSDAFLSWYNDDPAVNVSATKNITLTKVSESPLEYQFSSNSYFPIDGELFGNTPGFSHNYHFTTEIHTQFTYQGGETFAFSGDDDVWVFINGILAIDLGGVHGPLSASVNLDDQSEALGIVPGNIYDLDIFHAERHTTGSNFTITTSIVLENPPTPANLTITPDAHSFGEVNVGDTGAFTLFTVQNIGESAATNIELSFFNSDSSHFVMQNNTCTDISLVEGETCTAEVAFSPDSEGDKTTSLQVSSTAGGTPFAALSGTGMAVPLPAPASLTIEPLIHDFGDVQQGFTSSLGSFTVTNVGQSTSSPITVAFGNTNADQFNIQNDDCSGVELAGGESCTVDAQFAPTSTGPKTTTLEASATEGGAASASLTGTGTEAPSVTTGRIVVNHDEWTLSDTGFSNAPDASVFAQNIGDFFTPNNGPGNFLVYSSNFGLTGNSLRTTMETAGHTWNVDTTEDFTLPNLTQYDAIFLGGSPVPDNQVLTNYVDAGGNVYLMGGTGAGGSAGEAAAWNSFLAHFGLSFESATYNGLTGVLPSSGTHPILDGVTELYYGNGQTIDDSDLGNNLNIILFSGDLGIIAATDDSSLPPPNEAPVADAGDDQTVDEGTQVTLDGSASSDSDGTIVSYVWIQTDGPTVALSEPAAAMPTFIAPDVDADSVLTFELMVTDDDAADSAPDSVNVTVQNVVPPPPENVPPSANAGDDQAVAEGDAVTLDGSASTDPDSGPSPLTYSWVQTAGPSVILSDATAPMPTFTAPEVGSGGEILTFELTVSDGAATDTDTVTVQVNDVSPPPSSTSDAIRALIVKAEGMGANASMLMQAPALLEDDNPNNDAAACGKLGAFINHLEAQSGKKKLTHEQAQELIDDALKIEEMLGC